MKDFFEFMNSEKIQLRPNSSQSKEARKYFHSSRVENDSVSSKISRKIPSPQKGHDFLFGCILPAVQSQRELRAVSAHLATSPSQKVNTHSAENKPQENDGRQQGRLASAGEARTRIRGNGKRSERKQDKMLPARKKLPKNVDIAVEQMRMRNRRRPRS